MRTSHPGSGNRQRENDLHPWHSELGRALLFLENPILCSRRTKSICVWTPPQFSLWLLKAEEWHRLNQTALPQAGALSCIFPPPTLLLLLGV